MKRKTLLPYFILFSAHSNHHLVLGWGENYGYVNGYPVIAGLHFNFNNNCKLKNSWLMLNCRNADDSQSTCYGLREIFKWSDNDGNCTSSFDLLHWEVHPNYYFNKFNMHIDEDTSNGGYEWDFAFTSDDDIGNFHDAKVLCNNDIITSIIAKDGRNEKESEGYHLFYETTSVKDSLVGYDSITKSIPQENGKYCMALYPLMSILLKDLKHNKNNYDDLFVPAFNDSSNKNNNNWLNTGWIIIISVAGIAVLILLLVLLCNAVTKRKRRKQSTDHDSEMKKAPNVPPRTAFAASGTPRVTPHVSYNRHDSMDSLEV